jgi:hypothetical protein
LLIALGAIVSIVSLGLMIYAVRRERTTNDKSESVSPRAAAAIFCGDGLWVVFIAYRALAH